jgi:hypothetical protein
VLQRALDFADRPVPHRRDLFHRRDEVAVVVEVADDGAADVLQQFVARLQRELPQKVIRQRGRRRQRVLDRRQLLHFLRRARAKPVVEIIAEEVLVIGVVPRVGLFGCGLFLGLIGLLGFGGLELFRLHFLEKRIFDHFLSQQVRQLECGHRQQLDRLLQ